jgi:prepilin-type N-terminal cleavage/methylation domain-containing protein
MNSFSPKKRRIAGFTLIELLIVVAIIAILAAIAVPNFIEAQTRAKVSRVQADLRSMSTALESYRVDHNNYPEGTDNPARLPGEIVTFLGPLAAGYYTFAVSDGAGAIAGRDFHTVTTPIAYITTVLTDPFVPHGEPLLTYCYRTAKSTKNSYILTSFGPDNDLLSVEGGGPGKGTQNPNPVGTFADTGNPSRCGDINERGVIHYVEKTDATIVTNVDSAFGDLRTALRDLSYDPTNGTVSDGDLFRMP